LRDDDDVVLVARAVAGGGGLGSVLVPAINPADGDAAVLSEAIVAGVLAGIGMGPRSTSDTWVAPDGSFRVGVLEGRWRKPAAAFIGEGARQAARQARIAELTQEREFHELVAADAAARMSELDDQLAVVATERAALPGDQALRDAHTQARLEREAWQRAEQALADAVARVASARGAADAAQAAATEFAGDVALTPDRAGIAQVRA